ncbi:MAG: polyprenyl synthetase family protein [Gammaproteobacteria bacterium]|nr:polyprenyl synthetase family protein [Gammaproteobacteria bacterium]
MSTNQTTYYPDLNLNLKELLQEVIHKLDNIINDRLLDTECQLLIEISKYIFDSGGKRLRPLLLLLTAKLFSYQGENHIKLAAALEMIHTATLLHDDIIDNSAMRRNKTSAHLKWGTRNSIIAGDWLSTIAFGLAADTKNTQVIKSIPKMAKYMVQGELEQLRYKNTSDLSEEKYYKIIEAKTGLLFSIATELAACISNNTSEAIDQARLFGLHLGLAFQIQDDLLDYLGSSNIIGKNIGDDLLEGKLTLPMIYFKSRAPSKFKTVITKLRSHKFSGLDFQELKNNLHETAAIAESINQVIKQQNIALDYLAKLPNNKYSNYLVNLTSNIVIRDN